MDQRNPVKLEGVMVIQTENKCFDLGIDFIVEVAIPFKGLLNSKMYYIDNLVVEPKTFLRTLSLGKPCGTLSLFVLETFQCRSLELCVRTFTCVHVCVVLVTLASACRRQI